MDLTRSLTDAIVARDFARLRDLFAPGAGMRAVTPKKLIEDAGVEAIVARFTAWFGDLDRIELRGASAGRVATRGAITYELRTWDAEGAYDITQHAFVDVREGRIHRIDLLCSGFQDVAEVA